MKLGIFVNSSDGFQDCWMPFFTLFKTYGGIFRDSPIYLNTERVKFSFDGGDIRSTCVWPIGERERPSWSSCLLRGLESMEEDHLLYLQEDYFLKRPVCDAVVEEAVKIFEDVPNVGVVYLSSKGPRVVRSMAYSDSFLEICHPAPYMVNTQAAIWSKAFLHSLVRPWENGWMFEKFASVRVRNTGYRIFGLTSKALEDGEVIDYVWTGVMKGKWNRECVDLFRKHGQQVDFDRRGYYEERGRTKSRVEVCQKLFGRPSLALKSILSVFEPVGKPLTKV